MTYISWFSDYTPAYEVCRGVYSFVFQSVRPSMLPCVSPCHLALVIYGENTLFLNTDNT